MLKPKANQKIMPGQPFLISAFNPEIDRRSIPMATKIGESEDRKFREILALKGISISYYFREVIRKEIASQAIE